jgi:ABC-2 type transport system ATP-binding protein
MAQFTAQSYKIYRFLKADYFANSIFVIFVVWQVVWSLAKMETATASLSTDSGSIIDPIYAASPAFLQDIWTSSTKFYLDGTRVGYCFLFFYFRYATAIVTERANGLLEVQEIQGMLKSSYWLANYLNGFILNLVWICIWAIVLIIVGYCTASITFAFDMILTSHVATCMAILMAAIFQKSQNVIQIWLLLFVSYSFLDELPPIYGIFPFIGVFHIYNGVTSSSLITSSRFLTLVGSVIALITGMFICDFEYIYNYYSRKTSRASKKEVSATEFKVQMNADEREDSIKKEEAIVDDLEANSCYPGSEAIRLVHLIKQYKDKLAVNNISLRIKKNETFGIIGPNGAGKSTTFKMMYNAEKPTSGMVYLNSQLGNYSYLGVCQQKDIFWEYLTVMEHLKFYSLMNGIPEDRVEEWVEYICKLTMLQKEIHHSIPFMLSGGMKRRLSIAISMIGCRDSIILDEPSAGLDPDTRIKLWRTIEKLRNDNSKSVVLTTHLMEEAEALCDRIGIIKDGSLVALGTSSELKTLYGNTLKLNILVIVTKIDGEELEKTVRERINQITSSLSTELNSNVKIVREKCALRANGTATHLFLQYGILQQGVDIIFILKKIGSFCRDHEIIEFSFSETTLDEVFLYVMANLK